MPDDVFRDHTGVHPQRQAGLYSVGVSVLNGRLSGQTLLALADLVETHAGGELRTTVNQNFLIPGVPEASLTVVLDWLKTLGLHVEANNFWRGTVACTGTEFCKLAITETKGFARWLAEEMDARLPGFDQQLKLHITGCPNNCGQAWIGDIGLEGKKIKHNGKLVDAWYFALGGALGQHAGFARQINYRCRSEEVPDALEHLFRAYLDQREDGQNLRAWFAAHSNEELREILEAVPIPA
uniref:Nitrite/sulfite reductase, hemoprotein beta-component, ferrodoxin-like n=1 Tax=mine drainage metagenome TaxID=410659 RepID=E6QK85_9ZZZZ